MRKIKFQFSENIQSIEEIESFYNKMKKSLESQYNSSQNPNYDSDFLFMTDSEIRKECQFCLEELSREASFSLLSLIEAEFRKDFVYRTELKKHDKLSNIYRSTYNPAKKVYQYAYVDVVLNGWKQYRPECGDLINRIIDANNYRNWIAHGRYWVFKDNVKKYDFNDNLTLAKIVKATFGPEYLFNKIKKA
ncbi:MAG: hypothetical protein IJE73_06175 [Muribaculaceae bacterium]|nr:hypothetical protein [Muribaculaceae bacterium]